MNVELDSLSDMDGSSPSVAFDLDSDQGQQEMIEIDLSRTLLFI
jgi:hypothetical protein